MTAKERILDAMANDKLDEVFDRAELKILRTLQMHSEETVNILDELLDDILEILVPGGEEAGGGENDGDDGDEDDTARRTEDFLYPKPPKLILHSDGDNSDLEPKSGEAVDDED